MKKLFPILFMFIAASLLQAQSANELGNKFEQIEKQRAEYWKAKQFDKAAELLKSSVALFNSQSKKVQEDYSSVLPGTLYNIACAYSLNNQKDSAIVYLNEAIDAGFVDYMNAKKDTDFNNIKNEPRFTALLARLKEKGDYEYILKKYASYKSIESDIPPFSYQPKESKVLVDLRKKYNLDEVAGNGDEISKFINLMKWVHKIVKHDGSSMNPKEKGADAIIEICKKEKRGVNCRMMATILNEVYLSMGYKSRFITCMPMGEKFDDCHVINEVYSDTFHKWLWMDPTFETYVTDEKGIYLSIQETRYRLVNDLPVFASKEINWNGQPYGGGGEVYLHGYMAKNTYRFSIPSVSCSAYENIPMKERLYIELYPMGYNPKNVTLGKINDTVYYTTDDAKYWAAPKGN